MDIASKLKLYRQTKHMTQESLADKMNVSRKTISSWETGHSYPDINSLIQLGRIFGASLDDLVSEDDQLLEHYEQQDKQQQRDLKIAKVTYYLNSVLLLLSYVDLIRPWQFKIPFEPLFLLANIIIFLSHYSNWASFRKSRKLVYAILTFFVFFLINVGVATANPNFANFSPNNKMEGLGFTMGVLVLISSMSLSLILIIFFYPTLTKTK